jgi:hypothetical protein
VQALPNHPAESASKSPPPLFIVGCGRSGTTMFRLMLDAHPDLAVPGESHFIPDLYRHRRKYTTGGILDARTLADDIMRTLHVRLWGVPRMAVWRRLEELRQPGFAGVVAAVFSAYADCHNKTRWADKTPIYVLSMPLLARLFPTARFIHLIRDGRDVALSYVSVPWGPSTVWRAAQKWRRDVNAGRESGRALGPSRYLEIRYEDLVASPEEVLKETCGFADLEFHERMLDYHVRAQDRIEWRDGKEFHSSATRPPVSGARDWRSQMSVADTRAFEAVAGALLDELGYDRRHRSIPAGLRAQAEFRVAAAAAWAVGSRVKKVTLEATGRRKPASIDRAVDGAG